MALRSPSDMLHILCVCVKIGNRLYIHYIHILVLPELSAVKVNAVHRQVLGKYKYCTGIRYCPWDPHLPLFSKLGLIPSSELNVDNI